jgi:hypothetical protein
MRPAKLNLRFGDRKPIVILRDNNHLLAAAEITNSGKFQKYLKVSLILTGVSDCSLCQTEILYEIRIIVIEGETVSSNLLPSSSSSLCSTNCRALDE